MTKITTVLQQIQSRLVAPKSQRNTFRELQLPELRGHPERTETAAGRTRVQSSRCPMIWWRWRADIRQSDGNANLWRVSLRSASAYAREPIARKGMDDAQVTGSRHRHTLGSMR
jgi:hypothetical protein